MLCKDTCFCFLLLDRPPIQETASYPFYILGGARCDEGRDECEVGVHTTRVTSATCPFHSPSTIFLYILKGELNKWRWGGGEVGRWGGGEVGRWGRWGGEEVRR